MSDYKLSADSNRAGADGTGDEPARPARRAPSRHGAIARKLFTYSNYKSWAEKVRTAWAEEDENAEAPARRPRP